MQLSTKNLENIKSTIDELFQVDASLKEIHANMELLSNSDPDVLVGMILDLPMKSSPLPILMEEGDVDDPEQEPGKMKINFTNGESVIIDTFGLNGDLDEFGFGDEDRDIIYESLIPVSVAMVCLNFVYKELLKNKKHLVSKLIKLGFKQKADIKQ